MRRDAIVALALAGCGAGSAFVPPMEDHSPPPRHPEPELASRPYTAEQIRAASPAGRWMRDRIAQGAGPAEEVEYRFLDADAAGATILETDTADGALEPVHDRHRRTWDELAADADFPSAGTSIAPARVATAMPVPPVRLRVTSGGAPELSMDLLAFGGLGATP